MIGTVYSEFYGFFDGLKGVGPEEAVGLSAAETLRKQFRTAYPHRPEEDLLLARYQLPRPHDQICPGACQGGRKGVQLSV